MQLIFLLDLAAEFADMIEKKSRARQRLLEAA